MTTSAVKIAPEPKTSEATPVTREDVVEEIGARLRPRSKRPAGAGAKKKVTKKARTTKRASKVASAKSGSKSLDKPRAPTAAQLRKERQARRELVHTRVRGVASVVMPVFATAATVQCGHLVAHGSWGAGVACGMIAAGVYWTSIPHVAKGIRRSLHTDGFSAGAMALAIDGAAIAGEVARLTGGIQWLAVGMIAASVVLSATFNYLGFEKVDGED